MANDAVGKNIIQKPNTISFQNPIALVAIQQGGLFCTVWPFRVKSPFFREIFLRVLWVCPLLKNQHFQIPMRSGISTSTKWFFVYLIRKVCSSRIATSKSLFIYLFIFNIPSVCILNRNPYDFSDSDSDFDEEEDDKKTKKKKKKKVGRGDGFGWCFRFFFPFFF